MQRVATLKPQNTKNKSNIWNNKESIDRDERGKDTNQI